MRRGLYHHSLARVGAHRFMDSSERIRWHLELANKLAIAPEIFVLA
jgi:hypothetical protein